MDTLRKLQMEAKQHVALYFQKIENHTFKFQKNLKKILDIDNDEIYKRAKCQCEILCIVDNTKMTKSNTIHYSQMHAFIIFVQHKLLRITLRFYMIVIYQH
jgi:hypothetical protein